MRQYHEERMEQSSSNLTFERDRLEAVRVSHST